MCSVKSCTLTFETDGSTAGGAWLCAMRSHWDGDNTTWRRVVPWYLRFCVTFVIFLLRLHYSYECCPWSVDLCSTNQVLHTYGRLSLRGKTFATGTSAGAGTTGRCILSLGRLEIGIISPTSDEIENRAEGRAAGQRLCMSRRDAASDHSASIHWRPDTQGRW